MDFGVDERPVLARLAVFMDRKPFFKTHLIQLLTIIIRFALCVLAVYYTT